MVSGENDSTPSTLRQMKSRLFEDAFATPPLRSKTDSYSSDTKTSSTAKLINTCRAASTPPERPRCKHRNYSDTTQKSCLSRETNKDWLRKTLSRKRSQYYEDAFACRESNLTIRSQAPRDSLITADVRCNCCIESESDFLIDLAFLLSEIYQRPTGFILISIDTNSSILLDSSSEPAYLITITALSPDIATTKNKRTAGLVQSFMSEIAKIPANRGILQFRTTLHDNIVTYGLGGQEVERSTELSRNTARQLEEGNCIPPNCRSRKSSMAMPKICSKLVTATTRTMPCPMPRTNNTVTTTTDSGDDGHIKHKVKRRKSLMALLGF